MVHIDSLIKIGGSLMGKGEHFDDMIFEIEQQANRSNIVLTTGSKDISDIVRARLSDIFENKMSLENHIDITWKSRDMMSQVFTDINERFIPIFDLKQINSTIENGQIPVIIQYEILKNLRPFPLERGLSTDTTSAYFAHKLRADKFIKLTDVNGVYSDINDEKSLLDFVTTDELKSMGKTCICTALAGFLERVNLICHVSNGKNIDNLKKILSGNEGMKTIVLPR